MGSLWCYVEMARTGNRADNHNPLERKAGGSPPEPSLPCTVGSISALRTRGINRNWERNTEVTVKTHRLSSHPSVRESETPFPGADHT